MSYSTYKIIHLIAIMVVFLSLGGTIIYKVTAATNPHLRKLCAISHGIGMLLALIAGFGLLAKLKLGIPGWVILKVFIWIFLGLIPIFATRRPQSGIWVWTSAIILGTLAAYLAIIKPF
jgi:hypothetical protein